MSRRSDLDCKIYVGDLARDCNEKDVERAFSYYGRLRSVWVARNPAGFAFVEFEDPRDAEDAVRGLDGTSLCGSRIRVEHSTGKVRPKPWLRGGRGGGGRGGRRPFHPEDRCYECGETGHYAYDCPRHRSGRGSRRYSRSRSRSRSRGRRSYTRSRSRSRDQKRGRDRSRDRYAGRSPSRSRSRSAARNDN
ncbi:serine/arginine-rich splicing factor 7-like isoform X3 [Ruditapes philippinarum]|uniref:serine/arginine-rich splicing factor 7-like isoform X3 n=1 Tax=Ruditapes philippinarum TaxID=129788 RepID=UPI00295ADA8E|nr:serine/arginine-rich splicing factor 7-like isoform X3 [Ruditapes philippinarum]